jgi:ferritin-like metal-binding protein YciE
MFASKKIKIDRSLYDRLAAAAQRAGYATTEELIAHVLEREAASRDDELDQQQAEEQLRGLGYIE